MFIYYSTIIVSVIFMKLKDLTEDARAKRWCVVFSAFLLIIVAALRDFHVGTDTYGYVYPLFRKALQMGSLANFFSRYKANYEVGYLFLTYMIAKITHSFFGVLFINELIVIVFTYLAILYFDTPHIPAYMSLLCFSCAYYLHSYNIIRQCMAMALVMYCLVLFDQKKYFYAAVFQGIAMSFHYSSIVGIGVILLWVVSRTKMKRALLIVIAGVTIIGTSYFREAYYVLSKWFNFLPKRYGSNTYMFLREGKDTAISSYMYSIVGLLILLAFLIVRRIKEIDDYTFYLCIMLLSLFGASVASVSRFSWRIFMYFEQFSIFVFPQFATIVDADKRSERLGRWLIFLFMLFFFTFRFIIRNWGRVYPYSFYGA